MKPLVLIPIKPSIDFVGRKNIFFLITAILILGSAALVAVRGLNLGIDFQGGIMLEVKVSEPGKLAEMRSVLSGLDLGEVGLQEFGEPTDILIRVQRQEGGEAAQQAALSRIRQALGPTVEYRRTEFVGPQVSQDLMRAGVISVVLALGGIFAYIWFRYEWQFGVTGILATVHDVIATIGFFALTNLEFNLTSIAAILTIAGYSVNDTVVVFDRVREQLRRYKTMPLPELFNNAINETLSRTVVTGLTTLLALTCLYFVGGEVIAGFSAAIIFGVFVGTYSSVCVAVPLLLHIKINRGVIAREPEAEKAASRP